MDIGIVTFYYAHNYGAVLQAYALKTHLEKYGHNVKMFPHINYSVAGMYPENLRPNIPKRFFIDPTKWKYIVKELRRVKYSKKDWGIRYSKFDRFIKSELLDTSNTVEENNKDYDLLLFGSDQIWEKNIIGDDLTYFGKIDTAAIKASYAGSCFSNHSVFTEEMVSELKKFYRLSARESSVANRLSEITGKDVITVCDPVFLLEGNEYNKVADCVCSEKDYVLFYFVAEDTALSRLCEYIRNVRKQKVIEIHYSKYANESDEFRISDGPREFLYLINNANEVFTNSFHGTALSIIFHKQFYVKSLNMRLISILEKLELTNRNIAIDEGIVENFGFVDAKIDYGKVDALKKGYVDESKCYIVDILRKMEQECENKKTQSK